MSGSGQRASIISLPLAVGLALISALSLLAYFALSAYAPDLRGETNGDAHALSKSAIGFAGLRILLQEEGVSSSIDRGVANRSGAVPSLLVLTPEASSASADVKKLTLDRRCLIILPKWLPMSTPTNRDRVLRVGTFETSQIDDVLKDISSSTKIAQDKGNALVSLTVVDASFAYLPQKGPSIDTLQTISGPDWVPVIETGDGKIIMARRADSLIYVLADPDLMNTHGVADLSTAAAALSIVNALRGTDGPVDFDVTLNGFKGSPSVLKAMFAPPFLGATICAVIAAFLIAFHAFVRFGAAEREAAGFALGKRTLVDNSAELIRVMNREPNMAPRYAQVVRNSVLSALGVRRQMDRRQTDAVLAALARRADETKFGALVEEADHVRGKSDLMRIATRLFRWRERIIHAR